MAKKIKKPRTPKTRNWGAVAAHFRLELEAMVIRGRQLPRRLVVVGWHPNEQRSLE